MRRSTSINPFFQPAIGAVLAYSVGCIAPKDNSDSGGAATGYCEAMTDANTSYVEYGGGSSSSGLVYGRLITDESDDIHDPNFVGFVEYTLESVDVGGSQTPGETEMDGDFAETLGAGTWLYKLSDTRPPYTCSNEYEFEVEAGDTTYLCIDVNCTQ